jgi:glycosyltransferase involved in cell wall biosynthesis
MDKIKVLITDNQRLTPVDGGAQVRIFNQIKYLLNHFDITYIGVTAYDNILHKEKQITTNIKEIIVEIKKPILLFNSWLTNCVKGVHTFDVVISVYEHFNEEYKSTIRKYAQESDILISTHPWFFSFIKKNRNKILIYDSHNCEYLLKKDPLKKSMLGRIILWIIKKIEQDACRKSDCIFACSKDNKRSFVDIYKIKEDKIYVLPNSVDMQEIKPASEKEKLKAKKMLGIGNKKTILFVGTYYGPNNEGFNFILNELVPQLKDYVFLVAGNVNLYFYDVYGKDGKIPKNLKMFGKIDEQKYHEVLAASDIAVNPMFSGSGLNIKMLDYMAAGIPTISSNIGVRGLDITPNKEVIVCQVDSFEKEIRYLNEKKAKKMILGSLRIIREKYDSKKICKQFATQLEKIKK